jgi:hypothetical protein
LPKKKDRTAEEFYRGQIRELQKQNKALRRQLKELGKKEHMYDVTLAENQELLAEQEVIEIQKVAKCVKCHEGNLKLVLSLDSKDIFSCDHCDYKKTVKK